MGAGPETQRASAAASRAQVSIAHRAADDDEQGVAGR